MENFSPPPRHPDQLWGPNTPSHNGYQKFPTQWPGHEFEHLPPPTAKVC